MQCMLVERKNKRVVYYLSHIILTKLAVLLKLNDVVPAGNLDIFTFCPFRGSSGLLVSGKRKCRCLMQTDFEQQICVVAQQA